MLTMTYERFCHLSTLSTLFLSMGAKKTRKTCPAVGVFVHRTPPVMGPTAPLPNKGNSQHVKRVFSNN